MTSGERSAIELGLEEAQEKAHRAEEQAAHLKEALLREESSAVDLRSQLAEATAGQEESSELIDAGLALEEALASLEELGSKWQGKRLMPPWPRNKL